MKNTTKSLHTRVDVSKAYPAATPIYQNSAFEAQSDFFYSRKNNPNVQELEEAVGHMEGSKFGIATTTGMSAINLVLSLLKPNQTIVINKLIYGCTFKYFEWFSENYNCNLIIEDLSSDFLAEKYSADLVFFETPTNPFLKTVDINRVSNHYKKLNSNCIVVVDNTWASPLYQSPCNLGADISLHSATKYISGHSDVMGGIILTNDLKIDELIRTRRFYTGANLDPHSAWLLRRSLHTLDIRLEKQGKTTKKIISFLETRNEIDKVYYPVIDGIQMVDYATLLFFDFRKDLVAKYSIFSQKLQLFSTGTGMACVTSMVAQPFTGSHASMDSTEKENMGLSLSTIRLSFGLEDPNDLIIDIENALKALV